MPVDTLHSLYQGHEKRAQRVRDAAAGTDAIKARGELYLPSPSGPISLLPEGEQEAARARLEAYTKRALWLGVTGRTHEGMLGAVFRRAPRVDLPSILDYMREDADGSGMSLEQFGRMKVSALLQSGRGGILVDYPEASDGLTQEQTRGMKATLRSYDSESIINWRREGEQLTLVVLRETYEKEVDQFERTREAQFRVLSIEDGRYVQTVYRDNNEVPNARIEPKMANGQPWPVIPFQFLGSINNDEHPDKPVLLDLADVNLGHYRNSADLEESAFIAGQPMLHVDIGDMDIKDWQEMNPSGVLVGSRRGIQTKRGSITMVQAQERNLLLALMEQKEKQMLSIGARLIEQRGGNQTAEEVRARSGAENASLTSVAENVSDAIENALEWALMFMSGQSTDSVKFQLNKEFYDEKADPTEVMARIQELDRGLIAKQDYRDWRRRTGGIDPERTDEDIDADVESGGTRLEVM